MFFSPPLLQGFLIKRYKRFLVDIKLEDGTIITAHCPDPGSMQGLLEEGNPVRLSYSENLKRKYLYTWELVEVTFQEQKKWISINSLKANSLFKEALQKHSLHYFAPYSEIRSEVPYGSGSRIDFLLSEPFLDDCYIEIKSAHLMREKNIAEFPDSPSKRAAKHMNELSEMKKNGNRAAIVFVVQMDATSFKVANDIDPTYAKAFNSASEAGVEAYAFSCNVSPEHIEINKEIQIIKT